MKKIISILFLTSILFSCQRDGERDYNPQSDVISETEVLNLEEIFFLLNVKTSDSTYLVVKSIDSIRLFINTTLWSVCSSESIDTTYVDKKTSGNRWYSDKKINYLVVAQKNIEKPEFATAGDYAEYLNAIHILKQGEYALLIESFKITFNDNTSKRFYPYEYSIVTLEKNQRNLYAGEIELNIY